MTDIDPERLYLSADRPWRVEENLRYLYVEIGLSTRDTGDILGCSHTTVKKALREFGIGVRKPRPDLPDEIDDPDLLARLYEREGSTVRVGEIIGCSAKPVRKALRAAGYELEDPKSVPDIANDEATVRRLYEDDGLTGRELAREIGVSRETAFSRLDEFGIETRSPGARSSGATSLRDEALLRRLYVDEEMSTYEIGRDIGAGQSSVARWLVRHGIETRGPGPIPKPPEELVGRWAYYGPSWDSQRERAIQRDEERCVICSLHREWNRVVFGRDIEVHHVIPFDPDLPSEQQNDLPNLVTFCRRCHPVYQGIPLDTRALSEAV